jgi:DUF177 domain-containing protein
MAPLEPPRMVACQPGSGRYARVVTRFPLRTLRLRPGEEHREALALTLEPLRFGGELYEPSPRPIRAELVVQRATTGDLFRLRFRTRLDGPCVRCLAPAGLELEIDAQEYQAVDGPADPELRSEYVVEGELDVGAWARDQLSLAVPDQVVCRPDCAGLCPVCGKDLNVEPHGHDDASVDSRWAALEELRDPAE